MGWLRRSVAASAPLPGHVHDFTVSGPEGAETYTCWCGHVVVRQPAVPRGPKPPAGKAF